MAVVLALAVSVVVAPGLAHADAHDDAVARWAQDCGFQKVLARTERPLLDVERACQERIRDINWRHNQTFDRDVEAFFAYRLNVVEGVDRGALSPIRAAFLLSEYRRAMLAAQESALDAHRAEWLERRRQWDRDLQETLRAFDRPSRPTADCTTSWIGNIASTTCR
jgi:hypothetical protein